MELFSRSLRIINLIIKTKMKNIFIPIALVISNIISAQVIIQDDTGTATNKTSVLLEFSSAENRGFLLPSVRTMPTSPANGTILLDGTTPTNARVKYYKNGSWEDLSNARNQGGDITNHLASQPNTTEQSQKVIIGSDTSSVDGAMILESTTKAMVLPRVNSVNDIINPSPGMMVYVNKDKLLALYNGAKWSFWANIP